ncbi:MAG: filamentous hemagglutinin N-terminal domain-containing protein [Selenomonadaceae bacterium]|nr:filamentous hemagglutinin N-terminal domain-containing protein [Selenomonadaceae bacterium]
MNLWQKGKKSAVALAVSLVFSVGTALAMPTGGSVVTGDVSGITNGTVASGGTINVNSNALIDWNNFSIGSGEALNFAFNNADVVINHVIGNNISELMGVLNGSGGHVVLVNPNGIVVDSNASINVGGLTLSTLAASDTDLIYALNHEGQGVNWEDSSGVLTLNRGLSVEDVLELYGKVQIADGVTLSAGDSVKISDADITANGTLNIFSKGSIDISDSTVKTTEGDIQIWSAETLERTVNTADGYDERVYRATGDGNVVNVSNSTLNSADELQIYASSITVSDNSKLSNGGAAGGGLHLYALSDYTRTKKDGLEAANETFSTANTINIENSTLTDNPTSGDGSLSLAGGVVTIKDSNLTREVTTNSRYADIHIDALLSSSHGDNDSAGTHVENDTATADNVLTIDNSTINAGLLSLMAGAINITNGSKLNTDVALIASIRKLSNLAAQLDTDFSKISFTYDDTSTFGNNVTMDSTSTLTTTARQVILPGLTIESDNSNIDSDNNNGGNTNNNNNLQEEAQAIMQDESLSQNEKVVAIKELIVENEAYAANMREASGAQDKESQGNTPVMPENQSTPTDVNDANDNAPAISGVDEE